MVFGLKIIIDEAAIHDIFKKLVNLKVIALISSCLRDEDPELASWAVFLLHEFAYRNYEREAIRNIKSLLSLLSSMLKKGDNTIPRIIFRILKCLSKDNRDFKMKMASTNVLSKIVACMDTTDVETQYWSISLIHELLKIGSNMI